MPLDGTYSLNGKLAVLATMHRKEEVIAPVLESRLGLRTIVPPRFDTDRFGTFTREVRRKGSQLDAARAKIAAGFDVVPEATVGIASEGSFGPHPSFPVAALGRELVLLIDRDTGFELAGHDATPETNFGNRVVTRVEEAIEFAFRGGFPQHGVIIMAFADAAPNPALGLFKNIGGEPELVAAVGTLVGRFGSAFIEADMRASWNPTRMRSIERAVMDLARRFASRCPRCAHPGYDVTKLVAGLACARCGEPTAVIQSKLLSCVSCGHHEVLSATEDRVADPGQCEHCNP